MKKLKNILMYAFVGCMLVCNLPVTHAEETEAERKTSAPIEEKEGVEVIDLGDGFQLVITDPETSDKPNLLRSFSRSLTARGSFGLQFGRLLNVGTGVLAGDKFPGYKCVHINTPDGVHYEIPRELYLNGQRVYCIEPVVMTDEGAPYVPDNAINHISRVQEKQLGLISYFGYGYNNDYSVEMSAATIIAIWQYMGNNVSEYNQAVQDKINLINHRIATRNVKPSFNDTNVVLSGYGKENAVTITDTNDVLSDYHVYTDAGFKIEQNGNDIKIWAEKGTSNLSGTIEYDRFDRNGLSDPVVWVNADNKQRLYQAYRNDPNSAKINVKINIGQAVLTKTDDTKKAVSNATFKFAKNAGMTDVIGSYKTDSKGKITLTDWTVGTYYYQEISVNNPYVLDSTVRSFEVKYNETTTLSPTNNHQKATITIHKEDNETGNTPQGDATLDGWLFGVYKDKAKTQLIQQLRGAGNTATTNLLDVNQTVYIYELEAPRGYKINPNPITVTLSYSNQNVSVNKHTSVIKDEVIKGRVSVHKIVDQPVTAKTLLTKSSIKQPLANVKFDMTHDKTGRLVETLTTNADGYALSGYHPYGWYTLTERPTAGYDTLPPFKVFIDTDGKIYNYYVENTAIVTHLKIVKRDSVTGRTIPVKGIGFKLANSKGQQVQQHITYPIPSMIEEFYTGYDGTVTLPEPLTNDTYTIYELKGTVPDGYLLALEGKTFKVDGKTSEIVIDFANTPVKGKVTFTKSAEILQGYDYRMTEYGKIYEPIFDMGLLDDVTYKITARKDIKTADGSLWYRAGDVVDTFTTDGKTTYVNDNMHLGAYSLYEVATKDGYVRDTKVRDFDLTYAGEEIPLVEYEEELWNDKQRASITIKKELEESEYVNVEDVYQNITFGLFTAEPITINGVEEVPADSLLAVSDLSADLETTFGLDVAGKYYIQELNTDEHYVLDQNKYYFEWSYGDENTALTEITLESPIRNVLKRGEVEILKTDNEDHEPLQDITYGIYRDEECSDLIEEKKTNDLGYLKFENLELLHDYYVREVSTIDGFVKDDTIYKVSLTDDTPTVKLELVNTRIRGSLSIYKKDNKNNLLSDITFELADNPNFTDTQTITTVDGYAHVPDLLAGKYYLREVSTLDYLILDEMVYEFEITEHEQVITYNLINEVIPPDIPPTVTPSDIPPKVYNPPKTGDNYNTNMLLAIFTLSAIGIVGLTHLKRKKNKN